MARRRGAAGRRCNRKLGRWETAPIANCGPRIRRACGPLAGGCEAGISYEDVELDNLADVTARVFASLRRFAIKDTIGTPRGPAFAGADARRHEALDRAIAFRAPDLPVAQRRALAGLLDVLWSPPTYERLVGAWDLDNAEAIGAVQWLIAKVIAAIDDN